jgi:hypothetical protein
MAITRKAGTGVLIVSVTMRTMPAAGDRGYPVLVIKTESSSPKGEAGGGRFRHHSLDSRLARIHHTLVTTFRTRTLLLSGALGLVIGRGLSCLGGAPE